MISLVCASANPDKVAEIREILGDTVDLVPRPDDVPDVVEDADTLVGNARLKAVAIADATGMPAVADDTGLFVDALGGAPGVFTGRYAGEGCTQADNRRKLLTELSDVTDPTARTATFRTIAFVRWPSGDELVAEGTCQGIIPFDERSGAGGFGYDPVFVPVEAGGITFAEMTREAKHAISHRGRAFSALVDALRQRIMQQGAP